MMAGEARAPILERMNHNLSIYNEPRLLARSRVFPELNWVTSRLRMMHVRLLARRFLGDSPILWVFNPHVAPFLKGFRSRLLIYHMIDDYRTYFPASAVWMREITAERERRLLKEADIVFAVSEMLHQRALARNRNSFLVPNGVAYEVFESAAASSEVPPDLRCIPRPIIGYVGVIEPMMDFDLLDELTARHPFWSFVFVGPAELGIHAEKFDALLRRRNVYYLGPKSVSVVPHYIKSCDVCIMPDRERAGSDSLKLYEYLACGRPVVALDNPSARRFNGLVEIVLDRKHFAAAISKCLSEAKGLSELRIEEARGHSWRRRVEGMRKLLQKRLSETGGVERLLFTSATRNIS